MAKISLQLLLCAMSLLVSIPTASASTNGTVPVRLELLTDSTLQLDLGESREAPIRVRVLRRSDDVPLPGVRVQFLVNVLLCAPLMPCELPDPQMYGAFFPVSGSVHGPGVVTSDALGVATSPDFRAGSVAGHYEIATGAYLLLSQEYTSSGSITPVVQVLQGGALVFPPDPSPANIPADGPFGLALLVMLLMLSGAWLLRRR